MDGDAPVAIELRTERLTLRPVPQSVAARLPDDRSGAAAILGVSLDDDWPLADVLDMMPVQASGSAATGFGVWVVVERAANVVVGDIGFIGPPDDAGSIEMGYSIVPSRRRRGYATEATTAITAWVLDQPGVSAVVAETEASNEASARVLTRVRFAHTGATPTMVQWRLGRAGPRD